MKKQFITVGGRSQQHKTMVKLLMFGLLMFAVTPALASGASGGGAALTNAAGDIRRYVDGAKALIYAVAAVVGLVGGIRIFNKWQNGDNDVTKEIIGWVGAMIFILLVPTFVNAIIPAS